ncbi:hypothetical protein [Amycolatopsis sp. NPDC059657]|uniref:hypothetical protein n=1 Tax=Amycolatopsis sp. NPDC059657 TaxID=3346899 RepID=UPI00366E1CE0
MRPSRTWHGLPAGSPPRRNPGTSRSATNWARARRSGSPGTPRNADGFAWKPSAFLGRWRDESTWIVSEVTENTMNTMMAISVQLAEAVAQMRREQT